MLKSLQLPVGTIFTNVCCYHCRIVSGPCITWLLLGFVNTYCLQRDLNDHIQSANRYRRIYILRAGHETSHYVHQASETSPLYLCTISQLLSNINCSVPSSSALSAVLWMSQSFSPPLSIYQTVGCESSRCSRFLQPENSSMNNFTLYIRTIIAAVFSTLVAFVWLDELTCFL